MSMWQNILDSEMGKKVINFVLRYKKRFFVVLICLLMLYVLLSLLSYSTSDPAWSNFNSHQSPEVKNIGGSGGAWLADVMYVFFGYFAWLVFLWAMIEMYFVFAQSRLVLPLRLLSYAFLWVCFCMIGFGIAHFFDANALKIAGVVGNETFLGLAHLVKPVGSFLFAGLGVAVVGYFLGSFAYEGRKHFFDAWKKPIKTNLASLTTVNTQPAITHAKTSTLNHDKLLENFLKNSINQEELSGLEQLPAIASETESTPSPVPAPIPVSVSAPTPVPPIPAPAPSSEVKPKAVAISNDIFMRTPQSLNSALSSMNLAGVSVNQRYDSSYASTVNRAPESLAQESKQEVQTPIQEAVIRNPVVEAETTPIVQEIVVQETPIQETPLTPEAEAIQEIVVQETSIQEAPVQAVQKTQEALEVQEMVVENETEINKESILSSDVLVPTKRRYSLAFDDDESGASEASKMPDPKPEPIFEAPISQETVTQSVPKPIPLNDASKPNVLDDERFKNTSYAISVAEHRKSLSPLPSLDLLDPHPVHGMGYSETELVQLAELLEIKLREFGVNSVVMGISQGPVITSFEVELAAGIKASKVTGIAQDLARSLSVGSVRVVEVIPGKSHIGIEIPNKSRQTIRLIELLDTPEYKDSRGYITTAIGKDSIGNVILTDLYTAPHMLIAGATRSGKSVLVNGMILSMLLKYTPDELRFVMIDPKLLELNIYDDIPHLLTPVITEMEQSMAALSWCVEEMERRNRIMSSVKVRQISEFNKKVKEAEARGEPLYDSTWQPTDSVKDTPPRLKPMPFIVVVIDEYADLVSQVKQVEGLVDALARKSRASGIHIVLATQRPSVDVITGVIKANIPARIALSVRQKVDSRTILDMAGAESLLGNGDMLFIGNNSNDPVRVHGAYVTDAEVEKVCQAWRERGSPDYVDMSAGLDYSEGVKPIDNLDPLYNDALAFVLETGVTSISAVQRHLSIGYNRSAKILDSMEAQGVLSPLDHTNKRKILKQ